MCAQIKGKIHAACLCALGIYLQFLNTGWSLGFSGVSMSGSAAEEGSSGEQPMSKAREEQQSLQEPSEEQVMARNLARRNTKFIHINILCINLMESEEQFLQSFNSFPKQVPSAAAQWCWAPLWDGDRDEPRPGGSGERGDPYGAMDRKRQGSTTRTATQRTVPCFQTTAWTVRWSLAQPGIFCLLVVENCLGITWR